MKTYTDGDNDSNIMGYDYGESWIRVYFKDNSEYEYAGGEVGQYVIDQMKYLADSGEGLNSFIGKNKPKYSSKR
ncbi:TPA: hypothetical protein DEP94_02410 [Candidatus Nomurabacteria bacterium]|nr:hypothetical protein [Candidatus Nomurabacteria bacterium]